MAVTPNLLLTLLSAAQSQKHVTMNAALRVLDALQSIPTIKVLDNDLTAPPGSPADGDIYVPLATATGDWTGHEGKIAYFDSTGWVFYIPQEGWIIYLVDANIFQQYDGANWVGFPASMQNIALLGINTTADITNKLAVKSEAILFDNIGNGIQVKVNKAAAGDTNSFLFQTAFAAFAEFGCTGDDNFHFKVTPDNFSTTYEAFIISKDDGWTKFLGIDTVAATTLTIAAGVITVTQTPHKVDTESAASSDDLDTINGGAEGKIIIIEPANDARTVVLTNAVGNIRNSSGANVTLDAYGKSWMGRYDGANWIQIGGTA